MKKNWMPRVISLVAAVALTAQSMVMMAFGAVTSGQNIDWQATGTTSKQDVFLYENTGTLPADDAANTVTIASFEPANDWLVMNVTGGASYKAEVVGGNTVVSLTKDSDTKIVLTLTGDVTKRVINTTTPILRSVSVDKTNVDKGNNVVLTAVVSDYAGAVVQTPTIAWKNGGTQLSTANPATVPMNAVGTQNLTATVGNGTLAVPTITVKEPEVCNKTLGIAINGASGNSIPVGSGAQTVQYTAVPSYSGSCTVSTHDGNGDHGKPMNPLSWDIDATSTGKGFSINNNGLLTIPANLAVTTYNVTITATGTDGTTKAVAQLDVTRGAECEVGAVTGVTVTNNLSNPALLPVGANSTGTATFSAAFTFTGNSCAIVGHAPGHGKIVTWSVRQNGTTNTKPNGIDINASTGVLTATKATMNPNTKIDVIATETPTGKTGMQTLDVTRDSTCTKLITGFTANPNGAIGFATPSAPSRVFAEGNYMVFETKSNVATLNLASTGVLLMNGGACEHEAPTNAPGICSNLANHTLTWKITNGPFAGVEIDPKTGILKITRTSLGNNNNFTVEINATYGTGVGTAISQASAKLVIRLGTIPTTGGGGGGSAAEKEAERNSEQWDDVEYRFDDADSKDTVRVSLGSNTKMPTRIIDGLRGRNVDAEFSVDGGYTWHINGKDLNKTPAYQLYIPLGVKEVNDRDASRLAKDHDLETFRLSHEGSFYGTYYLEQRIDTDYAKKTVYLYKYVENASKLTYKGSAKVDADGFVKFPFTSASTYVITDRALYGETPNTKPSGGTSTGGGTTGGGGTYYPPATPPASSVAPPSSSSETSSSSSSESSSISEIPSSTPEISQPTDVEPEEPEKPEKKKSIPIIIPILLVVVTITIVAVVLLVKGGGMNIGG